MIFFEDGMEYKEQFYFFPTFWSLEPIPIKFSFIYFTSE